MISQPTGWSSSTRPLTIALDPLELLGLDAAAVGEVEAQLVGADVRAGLADAVAERARAAPS